MASQPVAHGSLSVGFQSLDILRNHLAYVSVEDLRKTAKAAGQGNLWVIQGISHPLCRKLLDKLFIMFNDALSDTGFKFALHEMVVN
jgi:hypothetical protein